MKKYSFFIAAILSFCLLFTSCGFSGSGIESLITPPLLREDQNEIMSLLERQTGQAVVLKYPVSGNNTSPFLTSDIDKNGEDELIAFYSSVTSEKVRIAVLNREKNRWAISSTAEGNGNAVLKTDFISFKSVSVNNLAVLYSGGAEGNVLTIYDLDAGGEEICSEITTEYEIIRLGSSIRDFIAMFQIKNEGIVKKQTVSYLTYTAEGAKISSSVTEEVAFSSYKKITSAIMPDFSVQFFVDFQTEAGVMTEIFSLKEGKLSAFMEPSHTRAVPLYCTDIDGDKVPEIPSSDETIVAAGSLSGVYPISWFGISGETIIKESEALVNPNFGYALIIPEKYKGKISVNTNDKGSALSVYIYTGEENDASREIFTIQAVYPTETENLSGYTKLKESNSVAYYGKVNNKIYDIHAELEITYDELKSCLIIL